MAQDERRAVFEEQSRHIGIGLEYLPAVARRLHHSRELGAAFDEILRRPRGTEEWHHIDRRSISASFAARTVTSALQSGAIMR